MSLRHFQSQTLQSLNCNYSPPLVLDTPTTPNIDYSPFLYNLIHIGSIQYEGGGGLYRPQYTIILIIGTPKMVPLMLGNPKP